jgi:hypothetical protein
MFYRWRRMEEEDRGRVWRLYGWFTALMAFGSCVGAVAWAARMMDLALQFSAFHNSSLLAGAFRWRAAFLVTYAVEFLCLSSAKLMVLDRMSMFAAPEGTGMRRRWAAAGRVVMAAVVLGNAAGLAANAAAAVHYHKAAAAYIEASAYFAPNITRSEYDSFRQSGFEEIVLAGSIASVQSFCEVAVLLLILVSFAAVGVLSARRVSARLVDVDAASAAAATGRALRRHMLGTTSFVFVTFVVRSVLSTMYAVVYQLRDDNGKCSLCESCHNEYTHIAEWMLYTPEFQLIIELTSSPLALLVALWGMTSKATLHLMKSSGQESALSLRLI